MSISSEISDTAGSVEWSAEEPPQIYGILDINLDSARVSGVESLWDRLLTRVLTQCQLGMAPRQTPVSL